MTVTQSGEVTRKEMDLDGFASAVNQLRRNLEEKKRKIYNEIGNYPTPITGCDQQFNYLLAQQRCLIRELARLETLSKEHLLENDDLTLVEAFIESSSCLDHETAIEIRPSIESNQLNN